MPRTRVAVDVGGTFTDVLVLDEDAADVTVASTPQDPMRAVLDGVAIISFVPAFGIHRARA